MLPLKPLKKSSQKRWKPLKTLLDIARDRKKASKEKQKMRNNSTVKQLNIFSLSFFYETVAFFAWQVIENAVIKHQHPYRYTLVL